MDPDASLYILEKKFLAPAGIWNPISSKTTKCSAHEGKKKAEQSRVIPISEKKFKIKTNIYAGK